MSKQNVNKSGQAMETHRTLAALLMERLAHYGVQILTNENGAICFFAPSPGHVGRPWAQSEYAQGLEDGAIRELQKLVRSSHALTEAILEELALSGQPLATEE